MHAPFPLRPTTLVAAMLLALSHNAQAQLIGTIQGTSHLSSFANSRVNNIAGIATAVETNGFWMQDAGDNNALTSDAIYVYRASKATNPVVGQSVLVTG